MTEVRAETERDHARVAELVRSAFGQPEEAALVARLREESAPHLSLVAERDGLVIGHVFFSPVTLEPAQGEPPLAGLAPLAVDPAHQRRGVGAALVRSGLEAGRALGWQGTFLVGDPAYYRRFGFVPAAPLGFRYGNPHFDAALQLHSFDRSALAGLHGRVCFHRAFAETETG